MNFIRTVLKILGVGLILGLGLIIGGFVAYKVLWLKEPPFIQEGMAAFTGAAAVFVFTLIGAWIKQFRERRLKSHNALVQVEYLLNSYLNVVEDNRVLAHDAQPSYEKHILHLLNFKAYEVNKDVLLSFRNMDFINEYFELTTDLRRHNESYKTVMKMYADLKDAFVRKALSEVEIKINFTMLRRHLSELEKSINGLNEKIQKVLCSARILLRRERPLMNALHQSRYSKKHEEEVQKELDKLEAEISASSEKSREEIEKLGLKRK